MRTVILLAVLIAAAAALIYLFVRSRKTAAPPPAPAPLRDPFADSGPQGDPRAIKVGDMLDIGIERVWVRGTLRLSEGGWQWAEHFVDEGGTGQRRWLSVEEDPDVRMVLWTSRPDDAVERRLRSAHSAHGEEPWLADKEGRAASFDTRHPAENASHSSGSTTVRGKPASAPSSPPRPSPSTPAATEPQPR